MLDIVIEDDKPTFDKQIKNLIRYAMNEPLISIDKVKVINCMDYGSSEELYSNNKAVENLIRTCLKYGFEEGQRFGKEKVIYKEVGNERDNKTHRDEYQGTDGGANRTVY